MQAKKQTAVWFNEDTVREVQALSSLKFSWFVKIAVTEKIETIKKEVARVRAEREACQRPTGQ